jgi:hypothetical protein
MITPIEGTYEDKRYLRFGVLSFEADTSDRTL